MTIGEAVITRVLFFCEKNDYSLNGLCNHCGITQSTMNNLRTGKSKNPTCATVKKICDGLSITMSEFFNDPMFEKLDPEVN